MRSAECQMQTQSPHFLVLTFLRDQLPVRIVSYPGQEMTLCYIRQAT